MRFSDGSAHSVLQEARLTVLDPDSPDCVRGVALGMGNPVPDWKMCAVARGKDACQVGLGRVNG